MSVEELETLIREFNYKKNGKDATIHFLAMMLMYFSNIDF